MNSKTIPRPHQSTREPASQLTRTTPMQFGGSVTAKLMLFATYEIDGCLKHLYSIAEGLQEPENGEDRAIDAIANRIETMNLKFMAYFDEVGAEFSLRALAEAVFPRFDRAEEELNVLLNEAHDGQAAENDGHHSATAPAPDRIEQGAQEMVALLRAIQIVSSETCMRLGEENDDPETRDYVAMAKLVMDSLESIMAPVQDIEVRAGFVRALTDLLCCNADGGGVALKRWNPLKETEFAFSGQLAAALQAKETEKTSRTRCSRPRTKKGVGVDQQAMTMDRASRPSVLSEAAMADIDAHLARTSDVIDVFLNGDGDEDADVVHVLDFAKVGIEKVKEVQDFDDAYHRLVEVESLLQAAKALAKDSKGTSPVALAGLCELFGATEILSGKFDGGIHDVARLRPAPKAQKPSVARARKEAAVA